MPSLRIRSTGSQVLNVLGDDPQNPLIQSPQYFMQIFERNSNQSIADAYSTVGQAAVTAATEQTLSQEFLDNTNKLRLGQSRFPLRYIFGGSLSTEAVSADALSQFNTFTGFDYLDVEMNTYHLRHHKSTATTIKVSNPSKDKKNLLKRGNIIKVYMGWVGVDIKLVFTGMISNSVEEWDQMSSSDFYINVTCIRYHDAIVQSTAFTEVLGDIDIEDLTIAIDGDYYAGWHNLINSINKIIEPVYGVKLKTDIALTTINLDVSSGAIEGFREIQRENDTTKFIIEANKYKTIASVIDSYLKKAIGAGRGKNPLRWYIDTGGNIRFPYNDFSSSTNPTPVDKHQIIIGDNAYGAKIIKEQGITPQFRTDEPFRLDEKNVKVKISMNGRNDYNVGDPVIIKQYNASSLSSEDPSSLSDEIITKDREVVFIIDQVHHKFISYESFDTFLTLIKPSEKFSLTDHVDDEENVNELDAFAQLEQNIMSRVNSMVERRVQQTLRMLRTPDGTGIGKIEDSNINGNNFLQTGHAADNTFKIKSTVVTDDDIEHVAPVDAALGPEVYQTDRNLNITSPYAVSHIINDKYYMSGIWYPISRRPYNEVFQKTLAHQVGEEWHSGNQKWVHHNGVLHPMSFDTDYMFRSPARSWELWPTEDIDYAGLAAPILDAGITARGAKQIIEEANPLDTVAPIPGTLDRPEPKKIAGEYTTHATDGKGTEGDKKVIIVTNKDRTVATKIIITHTDDLGANPTIHIIVDDQKADGSRMEFTMKDDGTTPIIELINGKLQGFMKNGTTPEIQLSTNKNEDAPFSFVELQNTTIIMEYTDTGTPANSSTATIESALITLAATKTRVDGDMDVTGKIVGGAT